jgi:acyl-CoA thioester hydrolase
MKEIGITFRGMVRQSDCDHMGHMNVMWYIGKFDEATWNLAAMMGMTSQYMKDAKRGMDAVDQRIAYRREALAGDVLIVRTAILELRPKSVRFVHEMFRGEGGDHLATLVVVGVHLDTAARKSVQFEPGILAASQAMIARDPALWDAWPPQTAHLAPSD